LPYHPPSAIPGKRGRREISIIGARGTQWLISISRSSAAASTAPASPAMPPAAACGSGWSRRTTWPPRPPRRAPARGLRGVLVEQNDLGSATSSASSKLIHGGLRYLEHYEFRLV